MHPHALLFAVVVGSSAPALAQSFNVDFGEPGAAPSSSYGAAGSPGFWNSIRGEHTTPALGPQAIDDMLLDLYGNPTGVGVHQFGGMDLILENDPSVSGNDALLMNDAIVTHSIPLKSCLYFNGLENGLYEVLMYTWNPNHPQVTNVSFIDTVPGQQFAGGAWPGQHAEGMTFTRFTVNVTNGFMGPHAGLPAGGDEVIGGALNGIQLRKLCGSTNYCASTPNTGGSNALIQGSDDCNTLGDGFTLTATGLPPGKTGLFYFGDLTVQSTFGNGLRCVGGTTVRLPPPSVASPSGTLQHLLDFGDPNSGGLITPGSTWHFQCWFRDSVGAGFNLSDALSVTFD